MGVWLTIRASVKILTAKISSESPEGYFAKFCTSENIPLYGITRGGGEQRSTVVELSLADMVTFPLTLSWFNSMQQLSQQRSGEGD